MLSSVKALSGGQQAVGMPVGMREPETKQQDKL